MSGDGAINGDEAAVSRFLSRVCVGADADSYSGKRVAKRFTEGVALEVILDSRKPTRISNVYMHNASDGGCAFWSKRKISPRMMVQLRACGDDGPDPWVTGSATHCTVGIRGFLVGVSFETE